jgi:putative nucleotidyltransferase with HDIG domain
MAHFGLRFGKSDVGQKPAPPPANFNFKARFVDDLHQMDQFPSLPTVVTRLMTMIKDPKVSTQDLGRALREDPPLTARVLRMANSPVYGSGTRILSVPEAMMRLGMLEVQNLIMSVGLIRTLQRSNRGLDYRAFWNHWYTVATAAEALARVTVSSGDQDGGAFTAGLLHDIGRFVLAQFYPDAVALVTKEMTQRRLPLCAAERRVLGIDHAEMGGLLATRWGLPKPILAAISHHHEPESADATLRRLPLLVHVAERTCETFDLGDPGEAEPGDGLSAAWAALGADQEQAQQVITTATASAAKSALLLDCA